MVGLLLVSSLFPAGPAAAHVFTKLDGNDSPGKLDLRSAAVSHTSTSVVHRISTYNAWTPQSLGNDSFFVIQIDKNNDRNYERCAFIFYTNRLRGSLSNCGARFIRYLPVAKLSGTAARVTIPKSETGGVYWWGAASLWDGPRPCARGCVDFAPNRFPDILHDLTRPIVTMDTSVLKIWESSTTRTFPFPFSLSDAHSGVKSWRLLAQPWGTTTWIVMASGTGGGFKNPEVTAEPGNYRYRVEATDKQGNRRLGPMRSVYVPLDDAELGTAGTFTNPSPVADLAAFEGGYQEVDSFTYTFSPTGGCEPLELIGPGGGVWHVEIRENGNFVGSLDGGDFDAAPRQTLYISAPCIPVTLEFLQTSGPDRFAVDAVTV